MRKEPGGETIEIEGPAFTRFLFGNSRAGLFWLPIRLFVGFTWLEAGWHKLSGDRLARTAAPRSQGYLAARRRDPGPGPAARRSPTTGTATFLQTLLDNDMPHVVRAAHRVRRDGSRARRSSSDS